MINLEILKSAILPIPGHTEQIAIADQMNDYWESALAAIQACDRQLALLAERRQALITAAVTGGITV
jgi:type I restriction enzyme S subunit